MTKNYTKSKILAGVTLAVSLTASTVFADLRQAQAALASKDFASANNLAQTYYKQSPYDAALIMARSLIEVGHLHWRNSMRVLPLTWFQIHLQPVF